MKKFFNNVVKAAQAACELLMVLIVNYSIPLYVVHSADEAHSFYGVYFSRKKAKRYCRYMRRKYDLNLRYGRIIACDLGKYW